MKSRSVRVDVSFSLRKRTFMGSWSERRKTHLVSLMHFLKLQRFLILIPLCALLAITASRADNQVEFQALNDSAQWTRKFFDAGTGNWRDRWFLDGELATLKNTDAGMHFSAGPVAGNHAHHAVLWTKDSFSGDLKIEFTYTRTDTEKRNVNILYIEATGTGEGPYAKDISQWNELRKVPTMSTYFKHMNALHISYAAFNNKPGEKKDDYLRVRRYPVKEGIGFRDIEVPPTYEDTGLFLPGKTYKVTVIKRGPTLYFHAQGEDITRSYVWDLSQKQAIEAGRVGVRHMFTRSAVYKDFAIYEWTK